MPETTEAVDVDAEISTWHDAQRHLDALAHSLDSVTLELTPNDRGRLLAERELWARVQAEVVARLAAATS